MDVTPVRLAAFPLARGPLEKDLPVSTIELDWYLVHTRPRQEEVAREHLERQGYGVYLPRLQLPRRRRGHWHDVIEPLFPRYLFAGARRNEQSLHPIRSTRGVFDPRAWGRVPIPPCHPHCSRSSVPGRTPRVSTSCARSS